MSHGGKSRSKSNRNNKTKKRKLTRFRLPPGIEAQICVNHDVVHAEPDGWYRLVHYTYRLPTTRHLHSVDYFVDTDVGLNLKLPAYAVDRVLEAKAGIKYTIPCRFAREVDLIRGLVAAHVRDHLGERYDPAHQPDRGARIDIVPAVMPTTCETVGNATLKNATKPILKPVCGNDLQTELSRGCPATMTPTGYATPDTSCRYCYSCSKKTAALKILSVNPLLMRQQLKVLRQERQPQGKSTQVLCIGVNTDPGYSLYREDLLALLEFCLVEGLIPVIRTKFLEYDLRVSKLLINTANVLVVSLGADELEPGLVAHGRTQADRIADGLRYLQDGVNVVAGVLVDPSQEGGGQLFKLALQAAMVTFSRIVMYALRAKGKERAKEFFGAYFENGSEQYERQGSLYVPAEVHPTIRKLIGRNRGAVRLCLKSTAGVYCGGCHVPGAKGVAKQGLRKAGARQGKPAAQSGKNEAEA